MSSQPSHGVVGTRGTMTRRKKSPDDRESQVDKRLFCARILSQTRSRASLHEHVQALHGVMPNAPGMVF
ncbi:hypothetical protein NDU88_000878 [Pleurodeles waltl]|uniref:Uncharacterized protein n=1 Tax=Pleurodeles waltl TaxID=8319 RepID=A0AAV7VUS7_PLEWA|nr:hypothetical protein NDU88_000878 [Pleurodeles waltl]